MLINSLVAELLNRSASTELDGGPIAKNNAYEAIELASWFAENRMEQSAAQLLARINSSEWMTRDLQKGVRTGSRLQKLVSALAEHMPLLLAEQVIEGDWWNYVAVWRAAIDHLEDEEVLRRVVTEARELEDIVCLNPDCEDISDDAFLSACLDGNSLAARVIVEVYGSWLPRERATLGLRWAADKGSLAVVQVLVESGVADPNVGTPTALEAAVERGRQPVVEWLLSVPATDPSVHAYDAVQRAINNRYGWIVELFLRDPRTSRETLDRLFCDNVSFVFHDRTAGEMATVTVPQVVFEDLQTLWTRDTDLQARPEFRVVQLPNGMPCVMTTPELSTLLRALLGPSNVGQHCKTVASWLQRFKLRGFAHKSPFKTLVYAEPNNLASRVIIYVGDWELRPARLHHRLARRARVLFKASFGVRVTVNLNRPEWTWTAPEVAALVELLGLPDEEWTLGARESRNVVLRRLADQ